MENNHLKQEQDVTDKEQRTSRNNKGMNARVSLKTTISSFQFTVKASVMLVHELSYVATQFLRN